MKSVKYSVFAERPVAIFCMALTLFGVWILLNV